MRSCGSSQSPASPPQRKETLSQTVGHHATVNAVARTVPQRELRNANAQVIDAVVAGETFVVTRNGVPVAELRPVSTARQSFVSKAELQALAAAGPHIDSAQFRSDLDRVADQIL